LKNGKNITGGSKDEVLWTTLRISYDHLDKDHQNMFLDIACFLVSFNKSTLCRMYWNGNDSCSPMLGLQNLKDTTTTGGYFAIRISSQTTKKKVSKSSLLRTIIPRKL